VGSQPAALRSGTTSGWACEGVAGGGHADVAADRADELGSDRDHDLGQ